MLWSFNESIIRNHLRFKATIDIVWWLAFQAYKGHDESHDLKNQGNFIELVKLLESHNDKLGGLVLENYPCQNAKYSSHIIQKEILSIFASNAWTVIHEEIEDLKFCIIFYEAKDEGKK
jgi:hypothetical protein